MSERMKIIRTVVRFSLALALVGVVFGSTMLVVRELPPDPSAPLIGLLGAIVGSLTTSLGFLIQAISRNPSDSQTRDGDD